MRPEIKKHIKDLKHEDPFIRIAAIESLKETGGNEVVPHLIEALNDDVQGIVSIATEALNIKRDPRALKPILDTMDKYHPSGKRDSYNHRAHMNTILDAVYNLTTPETLPLLIEAHSKTTIEGKRRLLETIIAKIEKTPR